MFTLYWQMLMDFEGARKLRIFHYFTCESLQLGIYFELQREKTEKLFTILLTKIMSGNTRRKKTHSTVASFVEKLVRMLESPDHQDIISWTQEGDAFVIKSVTKLTQTVLPVYFKHQNFSSFIRQLNMYNFNKVRRPEGDHVYVNEYFHRDTKYMLIDCRNEYKNIKRRTVEDKDDLVLYEATSNSALVREVNEMARKHKELESVIKHLVADNQNLRAENTKLWKRVEKNIEKSDKKLEKLLVFMLFGGQANAEGIDLAMIKQENQQDRPKNQIDNERQTPRQALANNLFSMLDKNKTSEGIRNLLNMYSQQNKPTKNSNDPRYINNETKEEQLEDPTLCLKHNGEEDEEVKSYGVVDDVNLFMDLEVPPSDNQSQLI